MKKDRWSQARSRCRRPLSSEDSGDHSLSVPAVSDGGASARRRASDAHPMCGFGGSFLTGGMNTRTCPSGHRRRTRGETCVHLFDIVCIALRHGPSVSAYGTVGRGLGVS